MFGLNEELALGLALTLVLGLGLGLDWIDQVRIRVGFGCLGLCVQVLSWATCCFLLQLMKFAAFYCFIMIIYLHCSIEIMQIERKQHLRNN